MKVNRWRMEAAMQMLLEHHADYNGTCGPKLDTGNFGVHYKDVHENGGVTLPCA